MFIKTLTVSALNNYIKKVIDSDFILKNACIKGEISNFKVHSSGHIYFSLKDEFSKINCIMFKNSAENLTFIPEEGMKVIVKGHISVYSRDGNYELYCDEIEPEGIGELFIALEKLKKKLEHEGLFAQEHKKEIPEIVRNVGIITSPTGAAVRDIINVTKRRNRKVNLLIYPSSVQGAGASSEVINGIQYFNKSKNVDVIIIARGGGSMEELWAFNNEELAGAVYKSDIPIISGVGHETDFTVIDFVCDRRAPTPSAAAELAVFDLDELSNKVMRYRDMLNLKTKANIKIRFSEIDYLRKSVVLNNPKKIVADQYKNIQQMQNLMNVKMKNKINLNFEELKKMNAVLYAHNPLNTLKRGYSVIEKEDNSVINSIDELRKCENVKIIMQDGSTSAHIKCID